MMSAKKVSSGSVITSAMTRGSTSTSIGSRPMVRIASTSSLTCMVPICAVKARAGAAGDDDGGQQDAHLAQHRDADQVDGEQSCAELAQLIAP